MVCPQTIVALAPMDAPFLTTVFKYCDLLFTALLGFITFVKTMLGPRNTSSSQTTPVYMETLFCTFTLLPKVTPGEITTFCPMLQFSPMTHSGITCEKCQIFVPFPIVEPGSTNADSCAK